MSSSSSVPKPEDFIESFPNTLPKIDGPPSYDTLSQAKELLKANAASVPSTRGGGSSGYLGIVLSDASYATVDPTAFVVPNYPGPQPVIPAGATAAQISEAVRLHAESLREWREYTNLQQALKKQLINSLDPVYLRARKDRNTGFAKVSLRDLLQFLFDNYGQITPIKLANNNEQIKTAWDPNTPFEMLIDQIENCQDLADAGNQPFTTEQILNTAYMLVFNTGLFFDDCKTWNKKPIAEKTWANFKTHFLKAQQELRLQQQTSKQAGFQANAVFSQKAKYDEATEALANLATATSSDRKAMETLTNTVANLTQQLQSKDAEIKQLKDKLRNNNRTRAPAKDNGSYCWSHGYMVAKNHTSASCRSPKEGHKQENKKKNSRILYSFTKLRPRLLQASRDETMVTRTCGGRLPLSDKKQKQGRILHVVLITTVMQWLVR